jgi:MFS family permease
VFVTSCATIVGGVTMLCLGRAWPITFAGTALAGTAGAMLVLLMPGIVADHHGPNRTAAFSAINGIPGLVGITMSLVVGGVIAAGGSWRWPYLVLALAIAAAFLAVVRRTPVPPSTQRSVPALPLLRRPDVRRPWLATVHAVLVEFPVGVWAVAYLKEVGHASGGLAVVLGAFWGLFMFTSRMALPRFVQITGEAGRAVGFALAATGALVMWTGPSLGLRVVGLSVVAIGVGPLYPLAVEGLYRSADGSDGTPAIDSVSLGALAALASGAAITVGPMAMGALADLVGLRHSLLIVPALAIAGVATSWPRATRVATAPEALVVGLSAGD